MSSISVASVAKASLLVAVPPLLTIASAIAAFALTISLARAVTLSSSLMAPLTSSIDSVSPSATSSKSVLDAQRSKNFPSLVFKLLNCYAIISCL